MKSSVISEKKHHLYLNMKCLSGLGSQTNKLQNLEDTYQSSYIHHI